MSLMMPFLVNSCQINSLGSQYLLSNKKAGFPEQDTMARELQEQSIMEEYQKHCSGLMSMVMTHSIWKKPRI
jgi:hypothetical protein